MPHRFADRSDDGPCVQIARDDHGLDGVGEALHIPVNEAMEVERLHCPGISRGYHSQVGCSYTEQDDKQIFPEVRSAAVPMGSADDTEHTARLAEATSIAGTGIPVR